MRIQTTFIVSSAFEQETPTEVETQSETESTSPHIEEFEDDIPAINWEILLNETGSNLEANATEQIPPVQKCD